MNAPRAFPTWSGPVGLADTNSTLTARGRTGATRPQPTGSARIAATADSRASSRSRTFRNPGAATSAEATGDVDPAFVDSLSSSAAIADAIVSGAIRYGLASRIAMLLAKSPWTGSAGRSIATSGRVAPSGHTGSAPEATARSQARPTTVLTTVRIGGGVLEAAGGGSVTGAESSGQGRVRDGTGPTTAHGSTNQKARPPFGSRV